jgi:cytochrome c556
MKTWMAAALAASTLAMAGHAQAQFQKPEDAVKYRQGALFVMGQHFGRVGAMAAGRVPFDAQVAQEQMEIVTTVAKLPWAGFTADSQEVRSRAEPNIWTEAAKFKEAGDKSLADLTALQAATRTGDLAAVRRAFSTAQSSCKACHDNFRN